PAGKPRARSLGIPFAGTPGRWNAITDVPGVQVGYTTLIEGDTVRTGVTAIHPRGPAGAADAVAAGLFSQNGNGEVTGVSWVEEGSVGGGTGMSCYDFKGGNGTASRLVDYAGTTYTVGAFLQANFGSREELTLAGLALGELLADDNPHAEHTAAPPGAGSVIA